MKCDNLGCNGAEMFVALTREDGAKYWLCPVCFQGVGEVSALEWEELMKSQSDANEKSKAFAEG